MDLGFTKKRAEYALTKCDNNVERSADYLFNNPEEEDIPVSNNSNQINFENNTIDIKKYCNLTKNSSVYNLYAFATHLGANAHSGHYVSHIFKNGSWVLYNDSKVARTSDPPIGKGYIYFFKNLSIS